MFTQARIKLTVWYILIIMVVSAIFSLAIYQVLRREVHRFTNLQEERWELSQQSQFDSPMSPRYLRVLVAKPDPALEREILGRIRVLLLMINGLVLVVSGGLAYILSAKTLQPIQQNMEDQRQFISDAGHELKTPLTALRTGMEVALRDQKLSLKEAKQLLSDSLEEVQVLQRMTQSLLQLSQGTLVRKKDAEPVEMMAVVTRAVKKVSPLAKEKQIVLVSELVPARVLGSQSQLSELAVILLDNAIKYSPEKKTVRISLKCERRQVVLKVADEGFGIEKHHLPHIFDRFYRVDQSRTRLGDGGHGLGLSIAQRIVVAHQGQLSVSSQPGAGSTFTVKIPGLRSRVI